MSIQEQQDNLLMSLAQRSGSLDGLLTTFFRFLHRNTDFYVVDPSPVRKVGFAPGQAESMLVQAFRKYPMRKPEDLNLAPGQHGPGAAPPSSGGGAKKKKTSTTGSKAKKKAAKAKPVEPKAGAGAGAGASTGAGAGAGGGAGAGASAESGKSGSAAPTVVTPTQKKASSDEFELPVRYTKEGKQLPIGNGGVGPAYTWTQTLEDVTVHVRVPDGTPSKAVDVNVKSLKLRVGVKGQKPLIEGTLPAKVLAGESMWTKEGSTVVITLDKVVHTWWKNVIEGHPEIDATKVDSTRNVTDYDEETQAAIRKIMFDQRQKAQGLPTSEELLLARAGMPPASAATPPHPPQPS